jgi:exonuclease I
VVRAAYALRPDGIVWPTDEEGRVTLKLERLTAANGIDHGMPTKRYRMCGPPSPWRG